ncbi:cytoskeleton protein RodZ [Methylohalomonas lacus]|uniref:Cytoskeleton protein RodZ n=1 Tax=Methylohalomonas lacus TaxID=398773 RepID=A0AAE3HKJ0_9GAMM|nr:RodZ domain-containing protein [Methylohalomonas lacus]MCS3902128.1 cytoskeleton protein RodZ [Methylohalomonas lacus]
MSETDDNAADDVRTGPTPGELLRQGREASGLTQQEAATKLHLHQRIVAALERDDETQLPTPIYVRGYLRNYARLLDLDSETVLAAYDARDNQHPELKPPVAAKSQVSSSDKPVRAVTYLLTLGLVVLLLAWWQSRHLGEEGLIDLDSWQLEEQSVEPIADVDEPADDSEAETVDSALGYPIPIVRHPGGPDMDASATQAESPAAATGDDATPEQLAPAPLTATADETEDDSRATGNDAGADAELLETLPEVGESGRGNSGDRGLRLSIEEESWIEVYDADGKRLYLGLAETGETIRVNGKPPLEVLLGYAPGVNVSYNGNPIDTLEQSQAGVAQFRVGD